MENIKKKGNSIKKLTAILLFVFCVLSSLFFVTEKSYANVREYKYTFDYGDGMKLVLTVKEDTDKSVTNPERYQILNRETENVGDCIVYKEVISGGRDVTYKNHTFSELTGISFASDDSKTIYNVGALAFAKSRNTTARKLMTGMLSAMVSHNGNMKYIKDTGFWFIGPTVITYAGYDPSLSDVDKLDFSGYYVAKGYKTKFELTTFNQAAYETSVFNPKDLYHKSEYFYFEKDGGKVNVSQVFCNDVYLLAYINDEIEQNTELGNYFKDMKVESDAVETEYVYWVKDKSYNKDDNSILVNVGPKDTNKIMFTFKYNPNGELLERSTKVSVHAVNLDSYEYIFKYNDFYDGASSLSYHPDYTSNVHRDIVSNFLSGVKLSIAKNKNSFVAIDGYGTTGALHKYIYVAKVDPDTATPEDGDMQVSLNKEITIDCDKLNDELVKQGGTLTPSELLIKENNGYVFEFNPKKNTIAFYKKNDNSFPGTNMDFGDMYSLFYKEDGKQFGLSFKMDPQSKTGTNFVQISNPKYGVQYTLNTIVSNNEVFNEFDEKFSFKWYKSEREDAMFFFANLDSNNDIILKMYDLKNINQATRGILETQVIDSSKITLLAQISIKDWLDISYHQKMLEGIEAVKRRENKGKLTSEILAPEEMTEELFDFFRVLGKYAKPLVMILVFFSIILAALYSIADNQNPQKRVLLKERIKHIVLGIIAFSAAFLIISIATHYFTKATNLMTAKDDEELAYDFIVDYSPDENWFLNLLEKIIIAVGDVIEWVVDFLASRMLLMNDRKLNIADVIFNVEDAGGISLYPFTNNEWIRYMYGYKLLSAIAIGFIAIAILKNVVVMLVNAGNVEKEMMVREDFLRVVGAVMAIVLAPYGVRLLLLLVNSLVKVIPVSTSRFDLNFENFGLIGSIGRIIYVTTELKIYLVFVVRKLMITFLLIATPFVFGVWAISGKFRSFDLWLGELLTNVFQIFSYAFTFFFLVVVMSNESNPFAILILLKMLIKFSDFVKDSLQGLFNQWGGINETAIADEAYEKAFNITSNENMYNKIWGVGKEKTGKLGGIFMKGSDWVDPKHLTKGGRYLHNIGNVMNGRLIDGYITEKQRNQNVANEFLSERNKALDKAGDIFNELKNYKNVEGFEEFKKKFFAGDVGIGDLNNMINNSKGITKDAYSKLKDYNDSMQEAQSYNRDYDRYIEKELKNRHVMSNISGYLSDKEIANATNKNINYGSMKANYQSKLKECNDVTRRLTSGELTDSEREKMQATERQLMGELIEDGEKLLSVSIELGLDPGVDIAKTSIEITQHLAKGGHQSLSFSQAESAMRQEELQDVLNKQIQKEKDAEMRESSIDAMGHIKNDIDTLDNLNNSANFKPEDNKKILGNVKNDTPKNDSTSKQDSTPKSEPKAPDASGDTISPKGTFKK